MAQYYDPGAKPSPFEVMIGKAQDVLIKYSPHMQEKFISLAVLGAFFNVIVHSFVCFQLWVGKERGKDLWSRMIGGRMFERFGSALHYTYSMVLPEVWSISQWLLDAPDATRRVLAFQIFVVGGGSMYHHVVLARPRAAPRSREAT